MSSSHEGPKRNRISVYHTLRSVSDWRYLIKGEEPAASNRHNDDNVSSSSTNELYEECEDFSQLQEKIKNAYSDRRDEIEAVYLYLDEPDKGPRMIFVKLVLQKEPTWVTKFLKASCP